MLHYHCEILLCFYLLFIIFSQATSSLFRPVMVLIVVKSIDPPSLFLLISTMRLESARSEGAQANLVEVCFFFLFIIQKD